VTRPLPSDFCKLARKWLGEQHLVTHYRAVANKLFFNRYRSDTPKQASALFRFHRDSFTGGLIASSGAPVCRVAVNGRSNCPQKR
jgi:hypothetical protein